MSKRQSLTDAVTTKSARTQSRTRTLITQARERPTKQVHAYLPVELHTQFKLKTVRENRKMGAVLVPLIADYVDM